MDSNIDLGNNIICLLKQDLAVKKENYHYLSCLGGNRSQLFYLMTSNILVKFVEEELKTSFSKTESGDLLLSLPNSAMELSNLISPINWINWINGNCSIKVSLFLKELRNALDLYLSVLNIRTITEEEMLDVNFLSEFKRHEDVEDLIKCCNICNEVIKVLSPVEDKVDSLCKESINKKYNELRYNSLLNKLTPKELKDTFNLLSNSKKYNIIVSVKTIIGLNRILKFNLDEILDTWMI